jgi:hypothetical protein
MADDTDNLSCTGKEKQKKPECIKINCAKEKKAVEDDTDLGPTYETTYCTEIRTRTRSTVYDAFLIILIIILCVIVFVVLVSFFMRQNLFHTGSINTGNLENFFENYIRTNIIWAIVTICYIMLIYAIIEIMRVAFILKGAYEFGENLEKQCDGIFMEKERGDYNVYTSYTVTSTNLDDCSKVSMGDIQKRLSVPYMVIVSIVIIVLIVSFITTLILGLPLINNITLSSEGTGVKLLLYGYIIGLIISQIILFSYWVYKTTDVLNPFTGVIKDDLNKFDLQPMVNNHLTYIVLVLVSILLILYMPQFMYPFLAQTNDTYEDYIPKLYPLTIFLFITLMIVMYLFIKSAKAFQTNIKDTYTTTTVTLNNLIIDRIKTNTLLRKELEKNITLDERSINSIASRVDLLDENTFKKYKCSLYAYLPHIDDKKNIAGIPFPQELKSIIEQSFLAGEQSIELKEALIDLYYKYKENETVMTPSDLKSSSIKLYLKKDLREDIENKNSDEIVKLINTHVILNDSFKRGNPLPADMVQLLKKLREDTSIKDTVNGYYSVISIITYIVLIIIAYAIYHVIYTNFQNIAIQYISLFAVVLLVIIGFIGWWAKEMWL